MLSPVAAGSLLAIGVGLGPLFFWRFQIGGLRIHPVRCEGWWLLRLPRLRNLLHCAFVLAQLHHLQKVAAAQKARLVLQALPAPLRVAQLILQLLFLLFQLLLSFQQTIDVTVDFGNLPWRRLGARSSG